MTKREYLKSAVPMILCVCAFALVMALAGDALAAGGLEGKTQKWFSRITEYLLTYIGPPLLLIAIIYGGILRYTADDPNRGNQVLRGCAVGGFLLTVAHAAKSFLLTA